MTPAAPPQIDRETFLSEHFALPQIPEVVQRMLEVLRTGEATASEVSELMEADPGLVAEVLKIVNSSYYGLPRKISEVKHAVAYLGLAEIERLALTAMVLQCLAPDRDEGFLDFWFHSFHSAMIAKRLCRDRITSTDPGELHTAVLLHDVGKLIYMQFFPDHFRHLNDCCRETGSLLPEAETRLEYPSHRELGVFLCERWRLPDTIQRACARHELEDLQQLDPDDEHHQDVQLICAANLLSNLSGDNLDDEHKTAMTQAVTAALELDEEAFLMLMGEVYDLKSEADVFLRQL